MVVPMAEIPPRHEIDAAVRRALAEDLGSAGDVTTDAVVPPEATCRARVVARAAGVVAGLPVFRAVYAELDPLVAVEWSVRDGDAVSPGDVLGTVGGPARSVLTGERVALNFLTLLSGVATLTRRYVEACAGTAAQVLCTRKTIPGLRALQRYAVAVGGGRLHRAGLHDGVLVKDNHVAVAGGVAEAVRRARAGAPHTLRVEVEVDGLEQLEEALAAGADAILLDNADLDTVKRAVDLVGDRVPLEISGGVSLDTIGQVAGAGRLLISVGRLTHSAPALDLALDVEVGPADPGP
ncbi:MAG: carboxylating nicotinate-nucleotide diphosphorylase [Actinobacteria bacterium]|nr:carboxylating nicotinate-nucleotide diphosphorylase [Actinomycetota bacterium]